MGNKLDKLKKPAAAALIGVTMAHGGVGASKDVKTDEIDPKPAEHRVDWVQRNGANLSTSSALPTWLSGSTNVVLIPAAKAPLSDVQFTYQATLPSEFGSLTANLGPIGFYSFKSESTSS